MEGKKTTIKLIRAQNGAYTYKKAIQSKSYKPRTRRWGSLLILFFQQSNDNPTSFELNVNDNVVENFINNHYLKDT